MPVEFPPVELATEEGLVAIGGELNTETLTEAYKNGIFPWPIEGISELTWFSPPLRGIIFTDHIHISKSFKRFLNKEPFKWSFNKKFEEVIFHCSQISRKQEQGTWITDEIISSYLELHKQKMAYSVEVYNQDDKLVGGLYGTCFGKMVSGESMFHLETNASKFALYQLLSFLKQKEVSFLDTQMVTPVINSFGAISIQRADFIKMINEIDKSKCIF